MRYAAACAVALLPLSAAARAEPIAINQDAWLNYAVIANAAQIGSDLRLNQHGTVNGISSVQISGTSDAEIWALQSGRSNTAVIYQSGWNTISRIGQQGPGDFSGHTDLPARYVGRETDDGYLSYFMAGGFSLVTLTDRNHTWISRFGRAR
jgi:hypothetical protein